jgi:hypothetical protein
VDGGGTYELDDGRGGFERGTWRAERFLSFLQLPAAGGDIAVGLMGELRLEVALEGGGAAVLTAGDRLSLLGERLDFEGRGPFSLSLGAGAPEREEGR